MKGNALRSAEPRRASRCVWGLPALFSLKGKLLINFYLPIFLLLRGGGGLPDLLREKQDSSQFKMNHTSCHAAQGEGSCNT